MSSYKTAEKLSERLDEMGKDMTNMIEELNGASSTLSKTNKADEPVSVVYQRTCQANKLALPNRPHPQLAPLAAAAHRPGHIRAAEQGQRRAEERPVAVLAIWQRTAKYGHGWQ